MSQVQAYQGYFRDGKFISQQPVILPENVEVFITITGREMSHNTISDERSPEKNAILGVLSVLPSKEDFLPEDIEAFERLEQGDYKFKMEERLP